MATTEIPTGTDLRTGTPAPTAVVDAVAAARDAFDRGVTRPVAWRERQLDALVRLLDHGEGRLLDALATDVGKPRMEAWASDLGVTASEVKLLRRNVGKWARPRRASLPLTALPGRGPRAARAPGHGADHRPLELPGAAPARAPGRRPRRGQRRRGQALRAGPGHLGRADRPAPAPPRPDAVQVVEGGPDVATELLGAALGPHLLHRLHQGRPGRGRGRRQAPHPGHPGAGRQVTGHRPPLAPTSRSRAAASSGASSSTPARPASPPTTSWSTKPSRTS